ncbi:DUF4276 family protein [Vibrio rhizosphaerae]|uniref:DUF4276 family protein n=1 Tax=Vibrio rhizosphaerae TaxID=398736 RepID=UPI00056DEA72|nr:DUF4276 family protein [Vibrio rhizosphaerae]
MSKFVNVYAIVEGKTEQVFIERVLQPYLALKNIFIFATQISKPGQKGGDVRFTRAKQDIGNHLKQRTDTLVTTFIDYYGTKEWPGLTDIPVGSMPAQIADHLNRATKQAVNDLYGDVRSEERFIPFVAMHEFEALLFSDSEVLANELGIDEQGVKDVLTECGEPESINNGPETAPSKRLNGWTASGKFPKTTMGITIAQRIGIQTMREKCPVFNQWLETLEASVEA